MPFTKTPYEIQREQQERAIRAQEEQQARQMAAQAWQSFANQDVGGEAIKPLNLPIDWQHGADIGAKHAAGVEQQLLEGQQKLEQIRAHGEESRAGTAFELALKAKYAPKKTGGGGPGPVSKIVEKILKLSHEQPTDPQQAERIKGEMSYWHTQLGRYGNSGRTAQKDIDESIGPVRGIQYGTGTKFGEKQAEWEAKKKEIDADLAQREADEALLKIDTKTGMGMDEPGLLAAKKAAAKRMDERAKAEAQQKQPAAELAPRAAPTAPPAASAAPTPKGSDSDWVKLPSGRWFNPKTRESREPRY